MDPRGAKLVFILVRCETLEMKKRVHDRFTITVNNTLLIIIVQLRAVRE